MKSGFVSLIGRPNVGKSTLLNAIMDRHIAITSNKPQTTRNLIQGIYNDDESQIIFVDTPGIHKPNHKLGQYLNKQAYYSINDVDVILFLVDATEELGPGDKFIIDHLKKIDKPVILIINKIDKVNKIKILPIMEKYNALFAFQEIIPLSGLKKDNVDTLLTTLKKYLPDSVKYYNDNQFTNQTRDFIIAEMVREKVFNLTDKEVPHSVACVTELIEKNNNAYKINVAIIVERDSLKRIIIGKQGAMIKEIGSLARQDLEKFLGKKVYLELFVKVEKKWRDKERLLSEFGYKDF